MSFQPPFLDGKARLSFINFFSHYSFTCAKVVDKALKIKSSPRRTGQQTRGSARMRRARSVRKNGRLGTSGEVARLQLIDFFKKSFHYFNETKSCNFRRIRTKLSRVESHRLKVYMTHIFFFKPGV